ncbi:MAG: hypothetical protein HY794_01535 [Desulfarculus sp.]|nr:hypothetical protein [Desulfarculus sp.]
MAPGAPQGRAALAFGRHQVDGVEVFLPPGLVVVGPALVIRLAGFWRFRRLAVEGVGGASSCAI